VRFAFTPVTAPGTATWTSSGGVVSSSTLTPSSTAGAQHIAESIFTLNSTSGTSSYIAFQMSSAAVLYASTSVYISVVQVEAGYGTNVLI